MHSPSSKDLDLRPSPVRRAGPQGSARRGAALSDTGAAAASVFCVLCGAGVERSARNVRGGKVPPTARRASSAGGKRAGRGRQEGGCARSRESRAEVCSQWREGGKERGTSSSSSCSSPPAAQPAPPPSPRRPERPKPQPQPQRSPCTWRSARPPELKLRLNRAHTKTPRLVHLEFESWGEDAPPSSSAGPWKSRPPSISRPCTPSR